METGTVRHSANRSLAKQPKFTTMYPYARKPQYIPTESRKWVMGFLQSIAVHIKVTMFLMTRLLANMHDALYRQ